MKDGGISRRTLLTGHLSARAPQAAIGENCFARMNVVCQSCGDACAAGAIRFQMRVGGPAIPELIAAMCTGCGDCVSACPAAAITLGVTGQDNHP
jgi:ferredoxin-type protein NapF